MNKHKIIVPIMCATMAMQPMTMVYAAEGEIDVNETVTVWQETQAAAESESSVQEEVSTPEAGDTAVSEEGASEAGAPEKGTPEAESKNTNQDEIKINDAEDKNLAEKTEETKVNASSSGEKAQGEQSDSVEKATQAFLDALNVTTNFVVYANTFNENCHIDGNIAVNKLETDADSPYVETLKKGGSQGAEAGKKDIDNYSIIYDGNNLTYCTVDNGALIVSGGNLSAQNMNAGSTLVDVSESLKTAATKEKEIDVIADAVADAQKNLSESEKAALKERVKKEADIQGNLDDIARKAAALNKQLAQREDMNGVDAVKAAIDLVDSKAVKKDSIIAVNVTVEELNNADSNLMSSISSLLQKNKEVGSRIILNVVTGKEESALTITQPLTGNGAYEEATEYIVWNFGDFGGTVTYAMTTEGVIVAPKATVNVVVMDGRVIADTAHQGEGQEIHQPNANKKGIPPTTPEDPAPQTPEDEIDPPDSYNHAPDPEKPNTDISSESKESSTKTEEGEEESQAPTGANTSRTDAPKTGDNNRIAGYLTALIVAIATLVMSPFKAWRRERK